LLNLTAKNHLPGAIFLDS